MKGIEVIDLFEKHGLGAHAIVGAVYYGLYPDYFGVRLKPFNCLTCEYAEPERRPPHDPGACQRHADRQAVAGISYCPHTPGGEPNAMVEDDGVEGTCKYGYAALRDIEFFERLKSCEFVRAEVEEYLNDLFPGRHRTAIQPRPIAATRSNPITETEAVGSGQKQQVGVPQLDPPESLPATSQEYNEQLRQRGFADPAARMYMIRNAQKPPWGKMTNYNAAAIALGRLIPEDKDEIDRLNSRYTEHVHNGLLAHLPKSKRTKKKQS